MTQPDSGSLVPRFFLDPKSLEHGPPRLLPGESDHALHVLRLRPGDTLEGLDGEGRIFDLRIVAASRHELGLELLAEPREEPPPGHPEAQLPWVEVAVAWPRKSRAEEMIGRLVQLGAAELTPLEARQSGAAPTPKKPPERWYKLAREACKQCGRSWMPELGASIQPAEIAERSGEAAIALLDPRYGMSIDTWLRSLRADKGIGSRDYPIVLAIGPEGGFDEAELDALRSTGATSVQIAPHILRIETAAEAAMAITAAVLMRG